MDTLFDRSASTGAQPPGNVLLRLLPVGAAPFLALVAILLVPGVLGITVGLGVLAVSLLFLLPFVRSTAMRVALSAVVVGYVAVATGVVVLEHTS